MPNYTSRKIEEFRKKFTSVRGNQADQLQRQLNVSEGFGYTETDEEFLARFKRDLDKFNESYTYGADFAGEDTVDSTLYAWEAANQVKSWKRGPISETVNLTYIFLAFIIGFSLCAVVMTPILINLI